MHIHLQAVSAIAKLSTLERLSLKRCTGFDAEMPVCTALRSLTQLSLSYTKIDDYRPPLQVTESF